MDGCQNLIFKFYQTIPPFTCVELFNIFSLTSPKYLPLVLEPNAERLDRDCNWKAGHGYEEAHPRTA